MEEENIGLAIGSAEPAEKVRKTVDKLGIHRIPLAADLDPREISRRYGAFYDEEKGFLHATGFLLLPGGKILNAVYSSGPIGRIMARDAINLVRAVKSEGKKSFHLVGGLLEVR
jgi:hypothetical protein